MDFSQGLVDDPALNNISSINTRQTLLIVNDFIAHTVDFMNKFATLSEQKLYQISQKTEKLDTLISLLEAKLESVPLHETDYRGPGVSGPVASSGDALPALTVASAEEIGTQQQTQPFPPPPPPQNNFSSGSSTLSAAAEQALAAINGEAAAAQQQQQQPSTAVVIADAGLGTALVASGGGGVIKNDPRYKKYFTMLVMGIPLPAVLQKLQIEGEGLLDPTILSLDPNTPVSSTSLTPYDDGGDDSD